MTPEQLWDNHSELILAEYISKRMMSRLDFLAALQEYGEAVRAENAELRKDAERYRWLVDNKFHHMAHPNGDGWGVSDLIYGDDIDYAIDKARSANNGS